MKKAVVLFILLTMVCSMTFAGQYLGADRNLNIDGAFTFMLLNNQKAKESTEKSKNSDFSIYKANAIGLKLEAQYDNTEWPVDFYLNGTFTFPNQYKMGNITQKKFDHESLNSASYKNAKTSWSLNKLAAGILYDIDLWFDQDELPVSLKLGGGINYNTLVSKDTGNDDLSIKCSDTQVFTSFGVEFKTDLRYYIGSNMYAKFGFDAGYSFLATFSDIKKIGTYYEGNKVPVQFASGFNMTTNLGLCYSF